MSFVNFLVIARARTGRGLGQLSGQLRAAFCAVLPPHACSASPGGFSEIPGAPFVLGLGARPQRAEAVIKLGCARVVVQVRALRGDTGF